VLWIFGFTGSRGFCMAKWITGLVWLLTGGRFVIGWIYDFWTLNQQISERNLAGRRTSH
jgi:hypothetical protein